VLNFGNRLRKAEDPIQVILGYNNNDIYAPPRQQSNKNIRSSIPDELAKFAKLREHAFVRVKKDLFEGKK
jgi:hypothetical protein